MARKKFFYALCIFLLLAFLASGCAGFALAQEEFFETYQVEPGTELEVYNKNGNIKVSSWDEDYVEVSALKKSWSGPRELEQVEVQVAANGGLVIRTEYLVKNPRISVHYDIRVPSSVYVTFLESSNGSVEVEQVIGDVSVSTSNGKIKIVDVEGFVAARTSNGKIDVYGASAITDLKTSNGNIYAEISAIDEKVEIVSSNGSITLAIASGLDANVEAQTSNGHVTVNNLQVVSSEQEARYLKGRLGAGGSVLYVKTSNGSIKLERL